MNEATRKEVTELLTKATFEGLPAEVRRDLVKTARVDGLVGLEGYMQLLDATNTHIATGSYEGCIIWRNAEANSIETES